MKFHTSIFLASFAMLVVAAGSQAAEMDKGQVVRDYTDTVMPENQQAYEAGIKAYKQCLQEHGFKFKWTALTHETGKVYVYSYVSDPLDWSDFDTIHETAGVCDSVWMSDVNPHLKKETSAFMVMKPEMSHMPNGADLGTGLIGVTYFTIKNGHEAHEMFTKMAKMIAHAATKTNWPGDFQSAAVQDAGPGAPDYVLVWPAKDWADFGSEIDPSLWKMLEEFYGKKKAGEIRKTLSEVIVHSSSHVDRYNEDLTYKPSGD